MSSRWSSVHYTQETCTDDSLLRRQVSRDFWLSELAYSSGPRARCASRLLRQLAWCKGFVCLMPGRDRAPVAALPARKDYRVVASSKGAIANASTAMQSLYRALVAALTLAHPPLAPDAWLRCAAPGQPALRFGCMT